MNFLIFKIIKKKMFIPSQSQNQDLIRFDTKANDNILKMIEDRNWKKMFESSKSEKKIINDVETGTYFKWRIFSKEDQKLALVLAKETSAQRDFTKIGLMDIVRQIWDVSKEKPEYNNLIILSYKNLGNTGKKYLDQQRKSGYLRIEHFRVENMRINIIEYFLQPKFRRLSKMEIITLQKKWSDLLKLPIMRIDDPIAIWYDYKNGDIILIERSIPKKHIYYRRVSSYELNIDEEEFASLSIS